MNLDHLESVTYQSYGPQVPIAGVWKKPLRRFHSLEGWFMEHMRISDGRLEGSDNEFEPRQISISHAVPHRINAFHLHPRTVQDEIWCAIQGTLLVWLVDMRSDSPTRGVRQREVLTGDEPSLLYIPTGVAHGFKAGSHGATLVYAANSQFSWETPNEGRLPWDFFGSCLWNEDRG